MEESGDKAEELRQAFLWPTPRVLLGQALAGVATAAIDVSDGLLTDLGRLLEASGVGAVVDLDQVPVAEHAAAVLGTRTALQLALDGGDDYELCCTVPETARSRLAALAGQGGCPLRIIGRIREGRGMTFTRGGEPAKAPETVPWSHFDGAEG
jgi:thiamine-monophosphate kinase